MPTREYVKCLIIGENMFIETKFVNLPQEISACRQLTHRILVTEEKWVFPEDNKSGIRVMRNGAKYELIDDYEEIAQWIGIFVDGKLVGCNRRCARLRNQFELERYVTIPSFLRDSTHSFESTRLAISRKYRSKKLIYHIAKFLYQQALIENQHYFFASATYPRPGRLYTSQLGLTRDVMQFKYNATDPQNCNIFYINMRDVDYVGAMIDKLTNLLQETALEG